MHATAFAPATVANVAVGFDLLGFAVDALGDRVTLSIGEPGIRVRVQGLSDSARIPTDPAQNTATVGLLQLIKDLDLDHGFDVHVDKGIPLGSGLGGSAASAVAGIVAANHILGEPLSKSQLLRYALMGEIVASGAAHPDNAAPCLYGGFTFAQGTEAPDVVNLPILRDISCVLVHPEIRLDTRKARSVLPAEYASEAVIGQTRNLSSFLIGLFNQDTERVFESCRDLLIEPYRKSLVPGFDQAQKAALDAGARAFSISGAGPTVFALTHPESANDVLEATRAAFDAQGLDHNGWITPMGSTGARIVEAS